MRPEGSTAFVAGLEETPRDKEILASFSRGMSYAAIAEARGVKPVTIRNAIYAIQSKLGLARSRRSWCAPCATACWMIDDMGLVSRKLTAANTLGPEICPLRRGRRQCFGNRKHPINPQGRRPTASSEEGRGGGYAHLLPMGPHLIGNAWQIQADSRPQRSGKS